MKRKRSQKDNGDNDTPRAFARLMAFHQGIKPPSGLDDGVTKPKKRKEVLQLPGERATYMETMTPKIQPGERIAEFSARVDASLPVSGLICKGTRRVKSLPGVKAPQTKMERRMQRMQKEWREAEAKRKEKLEAALEEAENGDEDVELNAAMLAVKPGKKRRKRNNQDDDPWAALSQSVVKTSVPGSLVGLHDVVQAPPQFTKLPKEKFRIRNGAKVDVLDVPSAAGSLRRREQLGQARRSIVEGYRQMTKDRKASNNR